MNFIYVHTHDSGRYMQPYGIAADNPNLMRFAREGFLFRQAHCTAPTCSSSRTGMLTGMAPHSSGMFGLAHRGFHMNDFNLHLAHHLHEHGYYTALAGTQHEAISMDLLDYDETFRKKDPDTRKDSLASLNAALDFLRSKRNGDKPFFLAFGMKSTHLVYEENHEIEEDYLMTPFPIVNTKETRHDYANYLQSLRTADYCVGAILDEVEKLGLKDDTVIMFTTDHGISFPDCKTTLKDTGTGVALMFTGAGIKHGSSDAIVSHVDVFPTICDILGVEKPERLQGKSLMPIMNGETDKINDYIFSEVTYHAAYEPMRAVRTDRYKYIRLFGDLKKPLTNIGDHESKDIYITSPYVYIDRDREQLYDLVADPVERINMVNYPEYKEIYEELKAVLEKWMKDTNDPLLDGPIELKEGQWANKTTDISPWQTIYDMNGNPKEQANPNITVDVK